MSTPWHEILIRLTCLFRGHDFISQYEKGRWYMLCLRCGEETPGIVLKK